MYVWSNEKNIITLPLEILTATKEFSEKVAITTKDNHIKRGHSGKTSQMNHFKGTLAEWAFYFWANKSGGKCTEPDMKIYPAYKKSYKEDLKWTLPEPDGRTINVHVKSQDEWSYKNYGASYVFTSTDRIHQMTGPNDYVVLTYLHSNSRIEIVKIAKGCNLEPYFKLPVESAYQNTKRAIYLEEFRDKCLV